jgi:FkbM family methyltransferase
VKQVAQKAIQTFLHLTGLEFLPVRVRQGLPAGARWTLYPWTSYWRGGYEPEVGQAITSLGDFHGKVCWDLGAHYGYYSVGLALRTGPTGQVAAFEPSPASFARLERHRRMNQLEWLLPFACALSDQSGESQLITHDGETMNHLAYDGEVTTAATPSIRIRTVRLDDLVDRGEIRPADFIKVDVEGHGHHALAGAIKTITAKWPVILMGFHSPQEVAGTEALLGPLGYRFEPVGRNDPASRVGADYLLKAGR